MYAFLTKYLDPRIAFVLVVIWYASLLFLVFLFSATPGAEFRYLEI